MILEFDKFNVILYFLTGVAVSVGLKQWIYGSAIIGMSTLIFLRNFLLSLNNTRILRFQDILKIPPYLLLILIIVISLFVLNKSSIEPPQKIFSIIFLLFSLGFSLAKNHFKDKPMFSLSISNYIPSLLFMVFLLSISIIPDNQEIIERKYEDFKNRNKKKI